MAKWHVIVSSELTEEMSLEEVKRAFHARRIGEDTLVWQKGMDRWLPLSQALSLRRDSSMPPAPPPFSFHVPPIVVEVVEVVEATGPRGPTRCHSPVPPVRGRVRPARGRVRPGRGRCGFIRGGFSAAERVLSRGRATRGSPGTWRRSWVQRRALVSSRMRFGYTS